MTRRTSPEATRRHTTGSLWSHERAAWVCAAPPSAGAEEPGKPLVDVRDMVVVHTALLREFRLAPAAVARVAVGARRPAAAVERHLALLCDLLQQHHAGEDELLWPLLRQRLPSSVVALLDEVEEQHAGIELALRNVARARRAWADRVDVGGCDRLVGALRTLHDLLAEHLDAEERTLLPLAAAYLTDSEWRTVGETAAASIPKATLPLVFGMFAYEGNPEVVAAMLDAAPALPRLVVPRIAPRLYARRAARVHGTRRP